MNISKLFKNDNIKEIVAKIKEADCVLIGAGAGLSAATGINYGDTETFAKLFPSLIPKGFRRQYELIGYEDWTPEEKWAYWSIHVNHVRFQFPPSPMYKKLLELIKDKDYFVITSNVDAMFHKTGFDKDRIFTPQGDYALLQCVRACTNETWETKPVIDKILPDINHDNLTVTDSSLIPHCPNCGGQVFMNVRLSRYFVEKPYEEQRKKYIQWLESSSSKKLVVMEYGVGFNTPGVIRFPFEQIVYRHPKANLIRVNEKHAQVPKELIEKSISVESNAAVLIDDLVNSRGHKNK
ncbi:Sir2 family NAD-dependent protein deacetylase [Cohnella silvisoli]|uniref:protein acetyllysine N-acetyltransferase n=1 Tax=Cohnella silvisoli TaxID=2873699 RepID=A0ABV1KMJ5_9BACL|nr:Sir2 family NAD-dependent protein deacetylase [Cohnella silvisoli]MCD9020359.1 hypothetical protein [Cohnella silvisoli]